MFLCFSDNQITVWNRLCKRSIEKKMKGLSACILKELELDNREAGEGIESAWIRRFLQILKQTLNEVSIL
ncbi:hypothetical protein [Candidatus Lariskella endosymbiont of Hedychridium roseum]|uniref:hypothetical protein n=1 Tax=Candidatus Lariskella endosymbiont of Hedychridium roseum TaxID=3077949 RepID=UPI0030CE1B2F